MPRAPENQDIAREVASLLRDTRKALPPAPLSFESLGLTVGTRINIINAKHGGKYGVGANDGPRERTGTVEGIYSRYLVVKVDAGYRLTIQRTDLTTGAVRIEVLAVGKEEDVTRLERAREILSCDQYLLHKGEGHSDIWICKKYDIASDTMIVLKREWGLPIGQPIAQPVVPQPPVQDNQNTTNDPPPAAEPKQGAHGEWESYVLTVIAEALAPLRDDIQALTRRVTEAERRYQVHEEILGSCGLLDVLHPVHVGELDGRVEHLNDALGAQIAEVAAHCRKLEEQLDRQDRLDLAEAGSVNDLAGLS
jgi:hypothetical protein